MYLVHESFHEDQTLRSSLDQGLEGTREPTGSGLNIDLRVYI